MEILLLFAFLAGFATVVSPCILPLLPAILAAGTGKGAYRPLGVILGFSLSFIFFTLALTTLVSSLGLSPNVLRYAAIVIIAVFGLVMIFPRLSDTFAAKTSQVADFGASLQSAAGSSSGFWSGLVLGLALGLVWTPCAGPILAAVTTLVATHAVNFETVLITITYTLGSAIPMFLIAYGGNKVVNSSRWLSQHAETIRKTFGVLMIATAFAIALDLHIWFMQKVVEYLPELKVENHPVVMDEILKLRRQQGGNAIFIIPAENQAEDQTGLPKLAGAPDIIGIETWLNSPPLTLDKLRGKVVLIDFWTYSCINCIRTLPYLTRWYDTYKDKGLVIVGVHTPEFEFEKDPQNVEAAIKRYGIHYPVALDNQYATWNHYNNIYWPAHYLIDQTGIVRMVHFGEGGYLETENAIRALLGLPALMKEPSEAEQRVKRPITPEIYLGYARADSYPSTVILKQNEVADYQYSGELQPDQVGLKGKWLVSAESIEAAEDGSELDLNFQATRVYLVMKGSNPKSVQVLVDDKPVPKEWITEDMDAQGGIVVMEARKYDIINLQMQYGRHMIRLKFPKDVKAFAFTFGDEK
jgi:cytochrome c biogenesis protein CcdA/thiol-disulfide isomerase/thioredoxin